MQDSEGRCHVVQMREAVPFRNHLCISFELLSINLYDYIKANSFKGSSLRLIRSAPHHAFARVLAAVRTWGKTQVCPCLTACDGIHLGITCFAALSGTRTQYYPMLHYQKHHCR